MRTCCPLSMQTENTVKSTHTHALCFYGSHELIQQMQSRALMASSRTVGIVHKGSSITPNVKNK